MDRKLETDQTQEVTSALPWVAPQVISEPPPPSGEPAPPTLEEKRRGVARAKVLKAKRRPPRSRAFDEAAMDRELVREGLVRNRIKETLTPEEDAALAFSITEELYEVSRPKGERRSVSIASSLERFGKRPRDLKHSHLIDLFQKDHFGGELDVELTLTAYLVIKGLVAQDVVACFAPALTYKQFHKLQAKIHREVELTLPPLFKDFLAYLSSLTDRQREALTLYHFENDERRSKKDIAKKLHISVDALKDRLEAAHRKLEAQFPTLIPSRTRRPAYWKTLFRAPDTRDRGMFIKSSAEKRHTGYYLDPVTWTRTGVVTPSPAQTRTPQKGWAESKAWQRATTHWPRHDGTASPLLAHLPNVFNFQRRLDLSNAGRTIQVSVSADPKAAFDRLPKKAPKESKHKSGKVLFDQEWLGQHAIEEREQDDADSGVEVE